MKIVAVELSDRVDRRLNGAKQSRQKQASQPDGIRHLEHVDIAVVRVGADFRPRQQHDFRVSANKISPGTTTSSGINTFMNPASTIPMRAWYMFLAPSTRWIMNWLMTLYQMLTENNPTGRGLARGGLVGHRLNYGQPIVGIDVNHVFDIVAATASRQTP